MGNLTEHDKSTLKRNGYTPEEITMFDVSDLSVDLSSKYWQKELAARKDYFSKAMIVLGIISPNPLPAYRKYCEMVNRSYFGGTRTILGEKFYLKGVLNG